MDVNCIDEDRRQFLLQTFRLFRARHQHLSEGYSNRDALENKLEFGGQLDKLDMYVLKVAFAKACPDYYQMVLHLFGE